MNNIIFKSIFSAAFSLFIVSIAFAGTVQQYLSAQQKVIKLAPPHSWEMEAALPESSGLQPGFMFFDCMHHNLAYPPQTLIRNYSGGTFSASCVSFRDPSVFLLHSNVDQLFAGEYMVEV